MDFTQELALLVRSGWRVVAIETFEEDRALRSLERVAQTCKRELVIWSLASGFDQGGGGGHLAADLLTIARKSGPALIVVLDAHRVLDDALVVRTLRDLLATLAKRKQTVVLLGPMLELPVELRREAGRLELPLPRADELERLFKASCKDGDGALLGDAARAALGLTAGEAIRVFRKARTVAGGLNERAVAEMVREKRLALHRTPALQFHEAEAGLGDVGGLDELKRWLRERRRAFTDEARGFGLPIPRGLLLLGVQGCGKSLCAKAVAREWQFPLLRLDLGAAFAGRGASPEASIREAVAVVESLAPAVLWVDEIEKGFMASGSDPSSNRVFASFLTWLAEKQSPVFVAATANDVAGLPPELLRRGRFDELFFVDLPGLAERVEILAIHVRKRGRDPLQFQLEELAGGAERHSGAELEQAVAAALYNAFSEGRDMTDADLGNAIQETVPLYDTYEERIKELRDWARSRARAATVDARMVDLFRRG